MSRCATPRADAGARREPDRGIALVATLIVMAVVAAIGLGLVLTTSLEPLAAANSETAWAACLAADSGIAIAAHELAGITDWDLVLGGGIGSVVLNQSGSTIELPDGSLASIADLTNSAVCGHASPCSAAEATAFTADRPWGPNNPRWRLFGHGRLDQLIPNGTGSRLVTVVVWVGDDFADADGDPFHDARLGPSGEWQPGAGVLALRAEAFAARGGHRTVVATIARPVSGATTGARLVSWHRSPGTG
jgi:hypothetical protein